MKITEAEAKVKLEQIGLPIHGTYDELIERLERNGLVENTIKPEAGFPKAVATPESLTVSAGPQTMTFSEQPKRGRPKVK